MSKSTKKTTQREKELVLDALTKSITNLQATDFIEKLLTESEKLTIGRRILIAQMIMAGYKQAEVRELLNVSPNTFTRTRKWLKGQIPEFDKTLKAYEAEQKKKKDVTNKTKRKNYDPTTFGGLRNKYPMHFLLFNVVDELFTQLDKKLQDKS